MLNQFEKIVKMFSSLSRLNVSIEILNVFCTSHCPFQKLEVHCSFLKSNLKMSMYSIYKTK